MEGNSKNFLNKGRESSLDAGKGPSPESLKRCESTYISQESNSKVSILVLRLKSKSSQYEKGWGRHLQLGYPHLSRPALGPTPLDITLSLQQAHRSPVPIQSTLSLLTPSLETSPLPSKSCLFLLWSHGSSFVPHTHFIPRSLYQQ